MGLPLPPPATGRKAERAPPCHALSRACQMSSQVISCVFPVGQVFPVATSAQLESLAGRSC